MKRFLCLLALVTCAYAISPGEPADCPMDGITSAWTHATKESYNNGHRILWCEYAHGPMQTGQAHRFWVECGD